MNLTEEILKAIEFSVESRMNLESDEQCTIIASSELIQAIRIAIAKGQIFSSIYNRLILQDNPSITNEYDMIIVPDSLIEEAIQQQIKDHLSHNEDTQQKLKALNDLMATIDEQTLSKISLSNEEDLTEEELQLKADVQSKMIEVGMNVDLMFTNKDSVSHNKAIDEVFDSVAKKHTVVNLKGLVNNEKEN